MKDRRIESSSLIVPRRIISRRSFVAGTAAAAASHRFSPVTVLGRSRQSSDAVVFLEGTDITTMDPQQVTDTPTNSVIYLLYDGLVQNDPENNIIPGAATDWETSEDGLTWTFHLREDITFSDGSPLTADDVVFTFERVKDPNNASPQRAQFEVVDQIRQVDEFTVEFITNVPFADLLVFLAGTGSSILSRAATEGKDSQEYGRAPVGSGPWMLEEWITGDRADFVPNPHYSGPDTPQVGRIVYRPVPEGSVRSAMIQTGEADIAVKIAPEDIPTLEGTSGVVAVKQPSMYQISFEINTATTSPPLDNVAFRQALNHAVDKEAIVQAILGGYGQVANSPFGPGIQFRAEFEPYAYDPDRARELMDEAGVSEGTTISLWSPDGRYLKDRQVAEAVQGFLQEVGLDATLEVWEWAPYTTAIREDETRQVFMVGRATPGADYTATRLFSSSAIGQYNSTNFSTDRIDELLDQGRSSFDSDERTAIYQEIQQIWWENAPWLFLHNQQALWAHQESVTGAAMWPHETFNLRNVSRSG